MNPKSILTALAIAITLCCQANTDMTSRQIYIEQYKDLAVKQMHLSEIPASIILAQAIVESSNGESDLARGSNNHFGIKCKRYWTGEKFYFEDDDHDDNGDLINSCFRSYSSVEESFMDHSVFLQNTAWYQELFTYGNDYKKWAHGLKRIGYASAPDYAEKLIHVIETNHLYELDYQSKPVSLTTDSSEIEDINESLKVEVPQVFSPVKQESLPESKIKVLQPIQIESATTANFYISQPVTREEVGAPPVQQYQSSFRMLLQSPIRSRFSIR